jgi:rhodanese-related sulfurtransferase
MRLTLLALMFTVGCGGSATPSAPTFPEISLGELKPLVDAKSVILLDVNGSDSYREGHIPGAIDFDANKDQLAALLPADKQSLIVAYCGGPKCSAWKDGAEAVASLGYEQVKHFKDGISGWKASNPVQTVQ